MLIDGLSGAAIGALMASPLNAVVTGIGVGVVGFTQSIITDAYTSNWDISKVRWGNAVAIGALTGLVSGIGKLFVNAGNNVGNYMTGNPRQVLLTAAIAKAFSKVTGWITSGVRSIINKILD